MDKEKELPDKMPSARQFYDNYFAKNYGWFKGGKIDDKNAVFLMESYAQLREQRAVEVERKKWEAEIQRRIDLFPDNDELPLSQRGSLDAYINCLKIFKPLNNGK